MPGGKGGRFMVKVSSQLKYFLQGVRNNAIRMVGVVGLRYIQVNPYTTIYRIN